MRRPLYIVLVPAICFAVAGLCPAGDLSLAGGNVTLTIHSAMAGSQPAGAESESCQLRWTTLVSDPIQKITIHTNLAAPHFTLRAQANDLHHGEDADEVTLSTMAHDFVTSIPANVTISDPGECGISYSASASAANGTGTDNHTITFTIVAQ
jgi:hypothetical protein